MLFHVSMNWILKSSENEKLLYEPFRRQLGWLLAAGFKFITLGGENPCVWKIWTLIFRIEAIPGEIISNNMGYRKSRSQEKNRCRERSWQYPLKKWKIKKKIKNDFFIFFKIISRDFGNTFWNAETCFFYWKCKNTKIKEIIIFGRAVRKKNLL